MADSPEIDAALEQAEALRQSGRHQQARVVLEALLADDPGNAEAHFRLGQLAANLGDVAGCRLHLQQAHEGDPGNVEISLRLGNACERGGDGDAALAAYRAALKSDPKCVPALIRIAELSLACGDRDGAVDACQRIVLVQGPVALALQDPRLPPPARETLTRIRNTLRDKYQALLDETRSYLADRYSAGELQRINAALDAVGNTRARGGHTKQRPEFLAFPGLDPVPWFEPEQFAWAAPAQAGWQTMRDEYLALRDDAGFHPYIVGSGDGRTLQGTDFSTLAGNRDWSAFHLNKAGWIEENCARCPQTAALMRELPLAEAEGYMPEVFYSVLAPGTEINPHFGQTNVRLTVHLGLIVPAGCGIRVADETRHWQEGRLLAFDDSFEHAAWNRGDSDRVVLIFEAWHPGLSTAEIDGLQHFFRTRSAWLARFADIAPPASGHA